jgi:hypothetical protein
LLRIVKNKPFALFFAPVILAGYKNACTAKNNRKKIVCEVLSGFHLKEKSKTV